jgi:hypothetical protein
MQQLLDLASRLAIRTAEDRAIVKQLMMLQDAAARQVKQSGLLDGKRFNGEALSHSDCATRHAETCTMSRFMAALHGHVCAQSKWSPMCSAELS